MDAYTLALTPIVSAQVKLISYPDSGSLPRWNEKAGLQRDAVSSRKTHSKCKMETGDEEG
jgi:hypothetical protein